jgi:hypothetical protein
MELEPRIAVAAKVGSLFASAEQALRLIPACAGMTTGDASLFAIAPRV